MSQEIQSMFDKVAPRYDFLNHLMSLKRDIAWRKKAVKKLSLYLTKDQPIRVLDLCGGTGDFMLELQKKYPHLEVSVLGDFSYPMLEYSKNKSVKAQPIQCDALKMPFVSESFDVVLCGYGVRNLDSLSQAFPEIKRVTKKGGFFMTLEFFRPTKVVPIFFYKLCAPLFVPLLGALFAKQKLAYQYLISSILGFVSVVEYQQKLEEYHFSKTWKWSCAGGISHIILAENKK